MDERREPGFGKQGRGTGSYSGGGCSDDPRPSGKRQTHRPRGRVKEGDAVQITSGPLKDLIGVFQKKMSGKDRVKILLNLIGVEVPVQISRWQIRRLDLVLLAAASYGVYSCL